MPVIRTPIIAFGLFVMLMAAATRPRAETVDRAVPRAILTPLVDEERTGGRRVDVGAVVPAGGLRGVAPEPKSGSHRRLHADHARVRSAATMAMNPGS